MIEIKHRTTGKTLYVAKDATDIRAAVMAAVKEKADLRGAYLGGADLRGAYLGGADLRGAYLGGAYLGGAYLGGAYLGGAYLGGAYLGGAYLGGAYLGGADLGGAYLGGANLREAIGYEDSAKADEDKTTEPSIEESLQTIALTIRSLPGPAGDLVHATIKALNAD